MEFGIELVTKIESRRISQHIFRFFCFLLGFTVGAICAAHGQHSRGLQAQLDELKAQYEQSTQQMQQRISSDYWLRRHCRQETVVKTNRIH
jgi:hypothetical protein